MRNIKRRHEYDYYLWIKRDKNRIQKIISLKKAEKMLEEVRDMNGF